MSWNETAEEKDRKEQQEEERREREQELEDVRFLINTPQGMRFFKLFFERAKVFTMSMTGNSWTYFNEGRRDIGNRVLADIVEADPTKVAALLLVVKKEDA